MANAADHSSCRGLGFAELNSKRLELKMASYKNKEIANIFKHFFVYS